MNYHWADSLDCAITVCDRKADVIYQNSSSIAVNGNAVGRNLRDCHSDNSWRQIEQMLSAGTSNTYTIEKRGQRKLIHQTPFFDSDGCVDGLVEMSIVLPDNMAHHVRG